MSFQMCTSAHVLLFAFAALVLSISAETPDPAAVVPEADFVDTGLNGAEKRLEAEWNGTGMQKTALKNMQAFPLMSAKPTGEGASRNWFRWTGKIAGPTGTPYAGHQFNLVMNFPKDYPFRAPRVTFSEPIYHPNINAAGRVQVNILGKGWNPGKDIEAVLEALIELLSHPVTNDCHRLEESEELVQSEAESFDATDKPVNYEVKALTGSQWSVPAPVGPFTTVGVFKAAFKKKSGYKTPDSELLLICNGKNMPDDSKPLVAYNCIPGSRIMLVIKGHVQNCINPKAGNTYLHDRGEFNVKAKFQADKLPKCTDCQ